MADFRLQIVTTERIVYDDDVTSIIAPGGAGYLGVLARHAPLLTTLKPGKLTLRRGDKATEHDVSGGFLEVNNNVATLLVDSIEGLEPKAKETAE